ncbi:MAG TPA: S8 family serine peptidase [bacterium]|jgi:hypothetical protein
MAALIVLLAGCSSGGGSVAPDVTGDSNPLNTVNAATDPISDENAGIDSSDYDNGDGEWAPGEILISLNEKISGDEGRAFLEAENLTLIKVLDMPWDTVYKVRTGKNENVLDTIYRLKNIPEVRYAEPNYKMEFDGAPYVPNDPMWERNDAGDDPRDSVYDQWGPAKSGAAIVWDETKGDPDIVVAVLDTGINYTHEDLANQVWVNEDEDPNNGIDDDNNGWIDDWRGWDFDEGNNDPFDTGWFASFHGSACSGVVAAEQDNERGLSGVAPGVKVMMVKLYLAWDQQLFIDSAIAALGYVYANQPDIVSMSFGTGSFSQGLKDACDAAYDSGHGVLLLASAGNSNNTQNHYPSGYDACMTIAACVAFSSGNSRVPEQRVSPAIGYSWGSTYGDNVEISGWGDKYTTTYGEHYDSYWDGSGDFFFGGTSCACPFTAGNMALLKSYYPTMSAEWLRLRLKNTADDIMAVGWDNQSGFGRVNIIRAIYGSERYEDLEDGNGFVPVDMPESMYNDTLHDVPGSSFLDTEDYYSITATENGPLEILLYITNWGEDLDMAVYSDAGMTDMIAEAATDNDPFSNTEFITIGARKNQTYYLKVYTRNEGDSSLYDLSFRNGREIDATGTSIDPGDIINGGTDIPLIKLTFNVFNQSIVDQINVSAFGSIDNSYIDSVSVWEDTDGSEDFSAGDTVVMSKLFGDFNRLKLTGLNVEVINPDTKTIFITANVSKPPSAETFGLSVETYKDVITELGFSPTYESFPIRSGPWQVGE